MFSCFFFFFLPRVFPNFSTVRFRKFLWRVLMVSFGLVMAQRLSGAGGVIQYSNTLFKLSGAAIESSTACIIVGAFQLAASGISFLLIDKVGRRTLLLISSGFVTTCLILLIFYFGLLERGMYSDTRTRAFVLNPLKKKSLNDFFF